MRAQEEESRIRKARYFLLTGELIVGLTEKRCEMSEGFDQASGPKRGDYLLNRIGRGARSRRFIISVFKKEFNCEMRHSQFLVEISYVCVLLLDDTKLSLKY